MCRRDIWHNTYDLFGVHRIEEWTYCPNSTGDQPCRRIHIHDHGDIEMAPERPRSAGYDMPFAPRIIERKPESEVREVFVRKVEERSKKLTFGFKFRDLFRPRKVEPPQPRYILRRPQAEPVEPEYVELREPRRTRSPLTDARRAASDDFVPLPPPVPSPRRWREEEPPILEIRSPRHAPIIHSPSSPLRQHRRHRTPSPPIPAREVETIRVRRLDRTDPGRAERQRARGVEEEARMERERQRRHDAEDASRHLAGIVMQERSERRRAERDAQYAVTQRHSAEIAAADLQRQNERLDRARRLAEREAAVLERERQRDQQGVRDAIGRSQDLFRPARDAPPPRVAPRAPADRGAEVIRAAQDARRRERRGRAVYLVNGRGAEQDRRH